MSLVESLLDRAGVEYHRSATDKNEITLCCPMPGCGDARFRLGINVKHGRGHCYNCDWKSSSPVRILQDLSKALGVPIRASELYRQSQAPLAPEEVLPVVTGLPDGYEPILGSIPDRLQRRALQYLQSRQVTEAQIKRHRVGFAAAGSMAGRIVFPVYGSDRQVYGCVGRDYTGSQHPKYLNTPGIKLMWNAFRKGKAAVVVEGVLDALRVELAVPSSIIPVAKLGSNVTPTQIKQLKKFKYVCVVPDWDEAGVKGAMADCDLYTAAGIEVYVTVPSQLDDQDPGSMSEGSIQQLLNSAVQWSHTVALRLRSRKRTSL